MIVIVAVVIRGSVAAVAVAVGLRPLEFIVATPCAQATAETTPAVVSVDALNSAAFQGVSVAATDDDGASNFLFEGPLELVDDCRNTTKVRCDLLGRLTALEPCDTDELSVGGRLFI